MFKTPGHVFKKVRDYDEKDNREGEDSSQALTSSEELEGARATPAPGNLIDFGDEPAMQPRQETPARTAADSEPKVRPPTGPFDPFGQGSSVVVVSQPARASLPVDCAATPATPSPRFQADSFADILNRDSPSVPEVPAPNFSAHSFADILGRPESSAASGSCALEAGGAAAAPGGQLPATSTKPGDVNQLRSSAALPTGGPASASASASAASTPGAIRPSRSQLDVLLESIGGTHPEGDASGHQGAVAAAATGPSTIAFEDLFGGLEGAQAPIASVSADSGKPSISKAGTPTRSSGAAGGRQPGGEDGEADGVAIQPRELLIYAVPLIKDKLVFLPVTAWTVDPEESAAGVSGRVSSVFSRIGDAVSTRWNSLADKDPESWKYKLYTHGQKILESMSAEERLMKNIPRNATKLVVYHPAAVEPIEVQEQLSTMTQNFCMKSAGKAAAAGLILPVAVGLEVLAVPGIGWFALYQLYKSSVTAAGGQRLKGYLGQTRDIRVNYAADPRMDLYKERSALSPEGVLSIDDIDDLCRDLQEGTLQHPLVQLRERFLDRHVEHKQDYRMLPDDEADKRHDGR